MYEVTIGIPVYNAEKYIRQSLESALAQTFASIDFLIIDDCGTDDSISIVQEYRKLHPRGENIRIVSQPYNKGIGATRNLIVEKALGHFLYFMDADDIITPNAIELLYDNAKRYNAEIVCGSHERIELYVGEENCNKCQYPQMVFLKKDEFAIWAYQKYDNFNAMIWNVLIDIDVYRKNNLKHQSISYWEDFIFTMDLPIYVNRAVLLPDVTYKYYCRLGSLSHFGCRKRIEKKEIQEIINAVEVLKYAVDKTSIKIYFDLRMYKLMLTDFYIACSVIRQFDIINPPFTNNEIRDIMSCPLPFREILRFRHNRLISLVLFFLGLFPPSLSVIFIRLLGKYKKLI